MFKNRHEAINHYKNESYKIDQDLQDFLIHHEAIKTAKINAALKRITELNDLIEWNKSELKKEVVQTKIEEE